MRAENVAVCSPRGSLFWDGHHTEDRSSYGIQWDFPWGKTMQKSFFRDGCDEGEYICLYWQYKSTLLLFCRISLLTEMEKIVLHEHYFCQIWFSVLLKLNLLFHVFHRWDSQDQGFLVSLEGLSSSWSSRGSSLQGLLSSQSLVTGSGWLWLRNTFVGAGKQSPVQCAAGQGAAVHGASSTVGCSGELQVSYGFAVRVSKRELQTCVNALFSLSRWENGSRDMVCLDLSICASRFPKKPSHCLALGWGWSECSGSSACSTSRGVGTVLSCSMLCLLEIQRFAEHLNFHDRSNKEAINIHMNELSILWSA